MKLCVFAGILNQSRHQVPCLNRWLCITIDRMTIHITFWSALPMWPVSTIKPIKAVSFIDVSTPTITLWSCDTAFWNTTSGRMFQCVAWFGEEGKTYKSSDVVPENGLIVLTSRQRANFGYHEKDVRCQSFTTHCPHTLRTGLILVYDSLKHYHTNRQ